MDFIIGDAGHDLMFMDQDIGVFKEWKEVKRTRVGGKALEARS